MRIDQVILRAAGVGLLVCVATILLADPRGVVDVPLEQILLDDLGPMLRLVAGVTGVLVVLSARAAGAALDPDQRRRAVPVLLTLFGVALVVFAATTPDRAPEAVASAPLVLDEPSTSGALNTLAQLLMSTSLPAAAIVQAARWRRDEQSRRRAVGAFVAAVVALWASFADSLAADSTLHGAGLWQRIAFGVAWTWLALLLLRLSTPAPDVTSGSEGTRT